MADIDDDLRKILEGAGKDIGKIRQALVGSSKALIKNTANQKDQALVVLNSQALRCPGFQANRRFLSGSWTFYQSKANQIYD